MTDIPVRLSVDDVTAGRVDWDFARKLDIYLDDQLQDQVVAYDIEAGTVTCLVTDETGQFVIDREAEETKRETIAGSVQVVFPATERLPRRH